MYNNLCTHTFVVIFVFIFIHDVDENFYHSVLARCIQNIINIVLKQYML